MPIKAMRLMEEGRRSSNPLRVLDVTKFYAPGGGGVKTYLDAKIADFSTRNVIHTLVIPGPEMTREIRGNTTVYQIPGVTIPYSPGYRLLLRAHLLREIIGRERPHVVEVGSPFMVPMVTRRATWGWRIPTVGFYHADLVRTYVDPYVTGLRTPLQEWIRRGARRYVRKVYSQFDATIAASRTVARELEALGVPKVTRISLGVDLACYSPQRRGPALKSSLGVPEGRPLALFAGRLCPEKGLDVVVEGHGRMDPATRPFLLFVGEGPSRPTFQAVADSRSDFTVLPFVRDKIELAGIYASSDIYLGAGPGETFGLSVAEAMASGTPVVAVDSGAVPDRLDGAGAGELYAPGDPESFRRALDRMHRRLGTDIRDRARKHALREYRWQRNFDALLHLYERTLEREVAA